MEHKLTLVGHNISPHQIYINLPRYISNVITSPISEADNDKFPETHSFLDRSTELARPNSYWDQ